LGIVSACLNAWPLRGRICASTSCGRRVRKPRESVPSRPARAPPHSPRVGRGPLGLCLAVRTANESITEMRSQVEARRASRGARRKAHVVVQTLDGDRRRVPS
jgi:hypothetical protein